MKITMSGQHAIGWWCWSVSASVPGIRPRTLAQGLTKARVKSFVKRVERLFSSPVDLVPMEGRLKLARSGGIGHGHWRLVWDVQRKSSAAFDSDLPLQTARKRRDELNAILDAICELQSDAKVVDRLKTELTNNEALLSQVTGPAVQALLKVNDELKKQILRLEYGPRLETGRAA